MNQKNIIPLMTILIIVLAGSTIYFAALFIHGSVYATPQKNTQQSNQQKQVDPITEIKEIVYKNSDFRFQVTLPWYWKNYKVRAEKRDDQDHILSVLNFFLPVSKKHDIGSEIPGYANLFAISVQDTKSWDKEAKQQSREMGCPIGPGSTCLADQRILLRDEDYVFSFAPGYATADVFQGIYTECDAKSILSSFSRL